MQQQKRTGTAPELALRHAAHRLGLRYLVNRRPLPSLRRTADLVFPGVKVAVFVDGCFWHGCPHHGRGQLRENTWYWPAKIASNQRRDLDTNEQLARHDWLAVRVWEHDDPDAAAELVQQIVESRRGPARARMPR
jgi:DNA mismatch endonuclease (patch repair protein)